MNNESKGNNKKIIIIFIALGLILITTGLILHFSSNKENGGKSSEGNNEEEKPIKKEDEKGNETKNETENIEENSHEIIEENNQEENVEDNNQDKVEDNNQIEENQTQNEETNPPVDNNETKNEDSNPTPPVVKYIVTFNSNGGSNISPQTVNENGVATRPANPAKEGYEFDNWYLGNSVYNFNSKVTQNITLVAHWNLSEIENNETFSFSKICRRAAAGTEHTTICNNSSSRGCAGSAAFEYGSLITYGNIKGTGNELVPGDAFDCDVNNDGEYDPTTERFYYVTSNGTGYGEKAVLIYYTNVSLGVSSSQTNYAYYESAAENWHGPQTAYLQLPSTVQWSNEQIIAPGTRQITNENGETTTYNGSNTIEMFIYTGKAARFLTYQELVAACGIAVGKYTTGELDGCNFLMENIGFYESMNTGTRGYWLETPRSTSSYQVWGVDGYYLFSRPMVVKYTFYYGIRPVIEVLKSNIEN